MKRILISNFPGRTGQFLILVIFIAIFAFSSQAQILNDDLSQGPATNIDATGLVQLLGGIACWLLRFAIIAVSIAMIFYGISFKAVVTVIILFFFLHCLSERNIFFYLTLLQ